MVETQNDNEPRVYTREEVRATFLTHVAALAHYWATVDFRGEGEDTPARRCHGTAFSVLAMLDGPSIDFPGFMVVPAPHEDDPEFKRDSGLNWYPVAENADHLMDIAGGLHEHYGRAEGLTKGTRMIDYTNHRGERSWRQITPIQTRFMRSEYHDGGRKQYIMIAYDHDKKAIREFATKDVHDDVAIDEFDPKRI